MAAASPVIPAAPPAAPVVAPVVAPATPVLVTEHTQLDAVQNRIATALAKARDAAPVVTPPANGVPVVPPLAAPVVAPAVPGAGATVQPVAAAPGADETDVDLEGLDFDSPPKVEAAPVELPADGVASPAATPEADVVKELADVLAKGEVPAKVEELFLKTTRGRQMLTSFKTLRDVAQPPEKGGIGRVPSLEEIRDADASHRSMTAMAFEYANDPLSFAANLLVPNAETGRTFLGDPASATKVLESIPQALLRASQTTNNPVYAHMLSAYSAPAFDLFFTHQYNEALRMPEETPQQVAQYKTANQEPPLLSDKIRMLDALQLSEFKAFGKARPLNWTPHQPVTPVSPTNDPEKAQLQEQLRAAQTQLQNGTRAQQQAVTSHIEASAKELALGDLGTALRVSGVDKIYPASVVTSQQTDLYERLKSSLGTLDPSGWQQYTIQLQQAQRGQIEPDVAAKTYRRLFQNAIRSAPAVRERINELVKGAKSHVDAQHANRQESQLRTEPNGPGAPAPSSVVSSQQLARQPGEAIEDFNTRRILAASQRVNR